MKTIKYNLNYLLEGMGYLKITCFMLILPFFGSSEVTVSYTPVSNLEIEVILVGGNDLCPNGDGSGIVKFAARANNAAQYVFRFSNGDVQESTSGITEHVFTKEGTHTYTIIAWACADSGECIHETVNITVFKSNQPYTKLVFSDEFEYHGNLDSEKWFHQVIPPNNGSWHNDELQHYTDRLENSSVSDGTLKIKALKEEFTAGGTTKSYTSARLNSKFAFTYGKVEVRAKLAKGAGTWPAIWTLGTNVNETGNYFGDQYGSVGWPDCGEIDIMEQTGWDKSQTLSYFHWGDTNTGEYDTAGGEVSTTGTTEDFHVYSLEWTTSSMISRIDDVIVYELKNTEDKPFDNPHYLLLNLAMGGNLGGEVPEDFYESTFEIDYVRIYQ